MTKGDKSTHASIFVMKGGSSLLGRDSSVSLGVVALTVDNVESYPQLFKGLGEMPHPYQIQLESGAQPYAVQYPRSSSTYAQS